MISWQDIFALLIVAAAAAAVIRYIWRNFFGAAEVGCDSCSRCAPKRDNDLISLDPPRRGQAKG